VNGSGFLVPGKPDANVTVYFVNPDGVAYNVQVVTTKRGAFNFTYTPSKTGNWTVAAKWDSDKDYWDSAYSLQKGLEVVAPQPPPKDGTEIVVGPPVEYCYALVLAIVAVIVTAIVVLKKRRKYRRSD
jgi:hypothetical protein